jgi:hypothetical protein
MNPTIVFTEEPNGCCPVQAEGTIDGFRFHFWALHDTWKVCIANSKDGGQMHGKCWIHEEEYPGDDKYCAGYASKQECVKFINVCAKLWAARKVEEKL